METALKHTPRPIIVLRSIERILSRPWLYSRYVCNQLSVVCVLLFFSTYHNWNNSSSSHSLTKDGAVSACASLNIFSSSTTTVL